MSQTPDEPDEERPSYEIVADATDPRLSDAVVYDVDDSGSITLVRGVLPPREQVRTEPGRHFLISNEFGDVRHAHQGQGVMDPRLTVLWDGSRVFRGVRTISELRSRFADLASVLARMEAAGWQVEPEGDQGADYELYLCSPEYFAREPQ